MGVRARLRRGGLGLTEAGLVLQAIGASGAGTSGASAVHFYVFPLTPVIRHGSVSLKATYLPAAARGSCWSPSA